MATGYQATCYRSLVICTLTVVLEKGEPVARRGRKATGLCLEEAARMPREDGWGDHRVILTLGLVAGVQITSTSWRNNTIMSHIYV